MPKDRRERSLSLERSREYPFPWSSGCSRHSLPHDPPEDSENIKEWEDARCPVCIEHPHNAILLLCSSHEKGCRPFMCDTSYRHSNCFDQFQKSFAEATPVQTPEDEPPNLISSLPPVSSISEAAEVESESSNREERLEAGNQSNSKLVCPLCRGAIKGWTILKKARCFMNNKSRSCASETCEFTGTYVDLRKHARLVHPLVRPADADPERQRSWSRLERQRDFGDLMSILQNSIGGEERIETNNNSSSLTMNDDGWLHTIYLLVRFIGPGEASSRTHARLAVRTRTRRSARLWGEALDMESDGNESSESSLDGPMLLRSLNDNTPSGSSHRRYLRRRYYRNEENQG